MPNRNISRVTATVKIAACQSHQHNPKARDAVTDQNLQKMRTSNEQAPGIPRIEFFQRFLLKLYSARFHHARIGNAKLIPEME